MQVRETLYRDLDGDARGQIHLRVAEVLERGAALAEVLSEIAHHRTQALPAGEPARALAASRAAAERAMALLAFEDAAALIERALQAAGAAVEARERCELTLLAGLARMRAGDGQAGRASCQEAAEQARRIGASDLLARAALGYGAEVMLSVSDTRLLDLLREALAALPPGPSGLRAQVQARLAAALQPADDVEPPMQLAREALAMARATGDREILRMVLSAAGSALADYAPPAERAALSEELAALATAAGDRVQLMRAQARLVIDYLELGQLDRCGRAIDAHEQLAREFRQPRHLWPARLMRAMLLDARGQFAEAARLAAEGRAIAASDGDPMTIPTLAWHRQGHALLSEQAEELQAADEEIQRVLTIPAFAHFAQVLVDMCLAGTRARTGDLAECRRRLQALPADHPLVTTNPEIVAMLGEAVLLTGDRRLGAALAAGMDRQRGLLLSYGRVGLVCLGAAEGAIALVEWLQGRDDQAQRDFDTACARNRELGLRPHLAQTLYWQGRHLLQRGAPGDAERAQPLLDEAGALARTLDLAILGERLRALAASPDAAALPRDLAAAAATAPRPSPRAGLAPAFTLVREGEIWTVRCGDDVCRLKDSRGLAMLAELVANPGREYHVLALAGGGEAGQSPDGGDAGALLDREAIADYKERVEELDEEIAEAESWSDAGRAARAREEREAIARELSRGVGLGGRERRAGGATERARTNVQRRLRGAIRKIGETFPSLAAYLDRTIRTGSFCSYEPL